MSASATLTTPVDLIRPLSAAPVSTGKASPEKLKTIAQQFEASFIGSMLSPMFDSLSTDGPFGGGEGEAAYKSFMTDAIAKSMAKHGGIGLAPAVQREMLKMQGGA